MLLWLFHHIINCIGLHQNATRSVQNRRVTRRVFFQRFIAGTGFFDLLESINLYIRYRFFYDRTNQLTRIEDASNNAVASYAYDALARRIERVDEKASTTLRFYYTDQRVIEDTDGSDTVQRHYIWGNYIDELLLMRDVAGVGGTANADYVVLRDERFSPTALVKRSDGSIAERYEHDAFGKTNFLNADFTVKGAQQSAYGLRYAYTGRELDILDAGGFTIMYFRGRYYDPATGAFYQRDPLGYPDGMNAYAGYFSIGGKMDPSGLDWMDDIMNGGPIVSPGQAAKQNIAHNLHDLDENGRRGSELYNNFRNGQETGMSNTEAALNTAIVAAASLTGVRNLDAAVQGSDALCPEKQLPTLNRWTRVFLGTGELLLTTSGLAAPITRAVDRAFATEAVDGVSALSSRLTIDAPTGWPKVPGSASTIEPIPVARLGGGTSSTLGNPSRAFWTTDVKATLPEIGAPAGNTGESLATGMLRPGSNVIVTPGGAAPGAYGVGGAPEIIIANPADNIYHMTITWTPDAP